MSRPELICGASFFGEGAYSEQRDVEDLVAWLSGHGVSHFDSAALYPVSEARRSETFLGDISRRHEVTVDTKLQLNGWKGNGSLTPEKIEQSLATSRTLLPNGINTLYFHTWDPDTPIDVSLKAITQHHEQGAFKKFGVSNFTPSQMAQTLAACAATGALKPMVYEGQYNALCRHAETSILPLCRSHGMQFVGYSPLGGGFLAGAFSDGRHAGTRFDESTFIGARMAKAQWDRPEYHAALRGLRTACDAHGVPLPEASLRWVYFHSALRAGDGIIFGGRRPEVARESAVAAQRGPLPAPLVEAFERAWKDVEHVKLGREVPGFE